MNTTLQRFVIAILIGMGANCVAQAQAPDIDSMDIVTRSVPDGPVALVENTPIDRLDFVLQYQVKLARFAARTEQDPDDVSDLDRARVGMQCMEELIQHELLYQHALEQNVSVDPDVVKERAELEYERVQKGLSESEGREVTEAEVLERLGYDSRQDINDEIERSMIITKMRETIVRDHVANLSPEELDRIYEKNVDRLVTPDAARLKQIFFRAEEGDAGAREAAEKRANEALGRIFSGQTFDSVAKEYSDLPQEVDMGLVPLSKLPDYLRTPVESMKKQDVSDVLAGPYGYHILQLVESKEGSSLTKEQAEDTIRYQMAVRQGGTVIRDYCAKLMEEGMNVVVFFEIQRNLMLLNDGDPFEGQ